MYYCKDCSGKHPHGALFVIILFLSTSVCSEKALAGLLCSQLLKMHAAGSKVSTLPCPLVTAVAQTIVQTLFIVKSTLYCKMHFLL